MTFAVALAIVLLSLIVGFTVARSRTVARNVETRTAHVLVVAAFAFASFIGVVEALGWVELFGARAIVSPLHEASLLCGVAVILLIWKFRLAREPVHETPTASPTSTDRLDRAARIALAAAGATLTITFTTTVLQFPRGFEGNAYHLPMAVRILRDHSLLPWDNYYPHTFPALASVFQGMFLYALPEKLASSTNFLFAPLLLAASYGSCRNMGADRSIAVIAACGILSIPVVAFGLLEAESDVIALAFICCAVFFASGGIRSAPLRACVAGILCGAAYGAKPSTLAASAAVGLIVTLTPIAELPAKSRTIAGRSLLAFIFATSFLLLSAYWFARPWLLYGNPLYPVGLPVFSRWFGWPLSEGFTLAAKGQSQFWYVRTPLEWFVYPWVEFEHTNQSFTAHAGYGAFVAAILIPCYLFVGVSLVKERPLNARVATLWLAVLIVVAGWAAVVREARYIAPAFAFLVPVGAYAIQQIHSKSRTFVKWLAVIALLLMNAATVAREVIGFGDRVIYSKMTERHLFYEYPQAIDALPPGAVVVNLSPRTAHYPLFGAKLLNHVVSTPAARAALGLPPTMGSISDARITAEAVRELGAEYIYTDGSVSAEGCIVLDEVARLDANPVNRQLLPSPRRLLKVSECRPVESPRPEVTRPGAPSSP